MGSTRNLRTAVAAVALAGIAAVGCSTSTGEDPDGASATTLAPEAMFTTALHVGQAFLDVPDRELIRIGYTVCEDFDNGVSFDELALQVAFNPVLRRRPEEAGYLIGAAATGLCPEHADEIR